MANRPAKQKVPGLRQQSTLRLDIEQLPPALRDRASDRQQATGYIPRQVTARAFIAGPPDRERPAPPPGGGR